jgi:muramoyltetrapeptide carboxypeptidase
MFPKNIFHVQSSVEYADNLWNLDQGIDCFEKNPGWKIYSHGEASGKTIGGNLGALLLLAGTEYWPNMQDKILFIEEDECEKPQTINRMLTQLRHIGVFNQIKALIIGRLPKSIGFDSQNSLEMILEDALQGYNLPVVMNVDFGHTDPVMTLPIGADCYVNTYEKQIIFQEAAVLF